MQESANDRWSCLFRSAPSPVSIKYAEMMIAAGKVVDQRTRMIRSASQSPLSGNYQELGKMVPEKVAAFGESAEILTRGWEHGRDQ